MVPTLCGSAREKMNNWLVTLFPPCTGHYFHLKNHLESRRANGHWQERVFLCDWTLQADHQRRVPAAAAQLPDGRALVSSGLLQLWVYRRNHAAMFNLWCEWMEPRTVKHNKQSTCCQSNPSLHRRTSSDRKLVSTTTYLVFWLSKGSLSSEISFLGEQND